MVFYKYIILQAHCFGGFQKKIQYSAAGTKLFTLINNKTKQRKKTITVFCWAEKQIG